jgi:hypothetical protein
MPRREPAGLQTGERVGQPFDQVRGLVHPGAGYPGRPAQQAGHLFTHERLVPDRLGGAGQHRRRIGVDRGQHPLGTRRHPGREPIQRSELVEALLMRQTSRIAGQ